MPGIAPSRTPARVPIGDPGPSRWQMPDVAGGCPAETSSPSGPTSPRRRCWPATGRGCSRCPRPTAAGLVVAGPARGAPAERGARLPLAAPLPAALRGQRRHLLRARCWPCAPTPPGPRGWITAEYRAVLPRAARRSAGRTRSRSGTGDHLAGGLFGVEVGGLFAAESKAHVVTDASKVAVVALADLLAADDRPRLIDVQWRTEHLATLGVVRGLARGLPAAVRAALSRSAAAERSAAGSAPPAGSGGAAADVGSGRRPPARARRRRRRPRAPERPPGSSQRLTASRVWPRSRHQAGTS